MTTIEERQLAHELVEAAVGREKVPQSHGKQGGSPARPDEQGEMGEITAADDSLSDPVENVHDLFLRNGAPDH